LYDPKHIRDYYDQYGDLETNRWEKSIVEKVKYFIHLHYLQKYFNMDEDILELGAGTGMFTQEIVKYAQKLVVTDLSSVQLHLNCCH
jgi:predicted TPR repeat methyltransferase